MRSREMYILRYYYVFTLELQMWHNMGKTDLVVTVQGALRWKSVIARFSGPTHHMMRVGSDSNDPRGPP